MKDLTISVEEFLTVFYPDVNPGESPLIAKPKNPLDPDSAYDHYAVSKGGLRKVHKHTETAWYCCVSTVDMKKSCEQGYRSRRQIDCSTAHMVFFDDLGDPDKAAKALPVVLTAMSETSQDNYQGYAKIHPFDIRSDDDRATYNAYIKGLGKMGYGDTGASGVERLYRLPGSVNTKTGRNRFKTRVVEWNPDVIYDFYDLMNRLGVQPLYEKQSNYSNIFEGDIPDDLKDPLLEWLKSTQRIRGGGEGSQFYVVPCPWSTEHTTGSDVAGYSPLGHGLLPEIRGFSCPHTHCKDRTTREFITEMVALGAPGVSANGASEITLRQLSPQADTLSVDDKEALLYATLPEIDKTALPNCCKTKDGLAKETQKPTSPNVGYLMNALSIKAAFNLQSRQVEFAFTDKALAKIASDPASIRRVLLDHAQLAGISNTGEVLEITGEKAMRSRYHPFEQWILRTVWDGVDRFDAIANAVTVTSGHSDMWRTALRRWLLQGVQAARGWRDPKQLSLVLVLAGGQGIGKSQFFNSLVPDAFFSGGIHLSLGGSGDKDSVMTATKTAISELGELDSTFKKSEIGRLKAFIATNTDELRKPYGREIERYPRATSFCATVNRVDFLVDETGNRRFAPNWADAICVDHGVDIGQLWAQVNTWWENGEQWWLTPEEEALYATTTEQFRSISDVEESITHYLSNHKGSTAPMNATSFAKDLLFVPSNRANLSEIRRILDRELHPRKRQIKGVANAWNIPTHTA